MSYLSERPNLQALEYLQEIYKNPPFLSVLLSPIDQLDPSVHHSHRCLRWSVSL